VTSDINAGRARCGTVPRDVIYGGDVCVSLSVSLLLIYLIVCTALCKNGWKDRDAVCTTCIHNGETDRQRLWFFSRFWRYI